MENDFDIDKKGASITVIIYVPYIYNNERIIVMNKNHFKGQLNHLVELITDDRNVRLSLNSIPAVAIIVVAAPAVADIVVG